MHSDLIEIGRVHGAADFALIASAFEGADIPFFLLHGEMVRNYGHQSIAFGGAILAVPKSHEKEALVFLHAVVPQQQTRVGWPLLAFIVFCFFFSTGGRNRI
jgi:hypothetical protein